MSRSGPGRPVRIGDLEIEPIERTTMAVESLGGGIAGVAIKEPVAVIIRTPDGTWRVDLEAPGGTA